MEIKILHMADVHLGRPVTELSKNLRDIRSQEVRSTFSKAISKAKDEKADVVLIAGDLFDSSETDKSTVAFIKGELARIPDIPVLVSPGNHDHLGNAYKMLDDGTLENLTIFGRDGGKKIFPEKNFAVYGIGFDKETQQTPLLKDVRAEDDSFVNIAVIHGELAPNSDYNPITDDDISKTNMDYIALGHVHTYSGIKKSGKTHYAYCGALEGGGFDECGEKGILFGTVSKEKCSLELCSISKRQYHTIDVDVTQCDTLQEIIDLVKSKTENKEDLYKIVLSGKRPETIPQGVIENEIGAFFSKVRDNTRGEYNLVEISTEYSLKGIFAKNVVDRMNDVTDEEKEKLLKASDLVMDILNSKK